MSVWGVCLLAAGLQNVKRKLHGGLVRFIYYSMHGCAGL
jgi:hypothetical protein